LPSFHSISRSEIVIWSLLVSAPCSGMSEETLDLPKNLAKRKWVTIPAMLIPFAASFFYFVLFPGTAFGNSFYSGTKFFITIWPIIAVGWILKEAFIDKSRIRQHRRSIVIGTTFGLVTAGLMIFLIKATPLHHVIFDNSEQIVERIRGLGVAEHFLIFAAFLSIIHAAMEEFFWRYFVFGQLRRFVPVSTAHLLAAAGFASHHVVILSQFFPFPWALALGTCVGIGGAVWSVIYQKTNSLAGSWISHMIVDFAIMWVGWLLLNGT